jgi:putative transcriptional regulator
MIRIKLHEQMGKKRIRSIRQLSEETGISRVPLANLYNETGKGIEYETLNTLCQFFKCSIGDLLEHVPDQEGS